MIKWILSDMDGTLLDNNSQLPPDFAETLALMKKHNIIFSPASGRQYSALYSIFEQYAEDMIFIAENGTYVCQNGKELYSRILSPHSIDYVINKVAGMPGVGIILSGKQTGYIISEDPLFHDDLKIYCTDFKLLKSFADIDDDIIKIAICDSHTRDARNTVYKELQDKVADADVILSGEAWVDVVPKGASKGLAIQRLQQQLNIKPEECMAFGDYLNDYEMLQVVGEAYAMQNAIPEILELAKHVAPPNYEYGVTQTIKRILTEKK